jgi:myo-inositol 2-dehydrogenase/D-chiro-inositol 1-dehydrogenase
MNDSAQRVSPRRTFLKTSAVTGLVALSSKTALGYQANSRLEIGIVGCGGRGTYVGGFFPEFTGASIVALADPFRDRMDALVAKLKISPPRMYGGLDGIRELCHSSLDAVVLTTPPYFRPEHIEEVIRAGKHVYSAKPLAVDIPGCNRIVKASAAGTEKKLSIWVDWQTRMSPAFREVAQRVFQGDIGDPVMAMAGFHTGRLKPGNTAGMTASQARLRNWVFDKALSGDIITEQNIHCLDVANWYLRGRPIRAFGTAGRKARVDVGDCSDHFIVTYWYPNNVHVEFSGAQFLKGGGQVYTRVYGSNGSALVNYGGSLDITGDKPWKGPVKDDTMGYTKENVKLFADAVRRGEPVNNVATSVESTMSTILGHLACERERVITWDEMVKAAEKVEVKLQI